MWQWLRRLGSTPREFRVYRVTRCGALCPFHSDAITYGGTREQLLYACLDAIHLHCYPDRLARPTPLSNTELRDLVRYVGAQIERLELTLAEITKIREKLETLA